MFRILRPGTSIVNAQGLRPIPFPYRAGSTPIPPLCTVVRMNTTRTHQSLVAAIIVALAFTGCAMTPAESNLVPAPQKPLSAPLDRTGAALQNDNDPRGHHGLASISGATGMPTGTAGSASRDATGPTPRLSDDDPRGHHQLPAIEGADGFGIPAAPLVSDDDPRGFHHLPRSSR